jgi:Putative Actinobacterial Holin-X, holin superfamily III
MAAPRTERSFGDLFGSLTSQLGQLIHKEVELARTELTANAVRTGRNAALVGAGAAIGYAGFLAVVVAAIALLAEVGLPGWLAALLVGLVLLVIAVVLVQRGRAQLSSGSIAPDRTIKTLRDDADWAKEQTR